MAIEKISTVQGTALPLPGDNIDTDRIIPARFLKSISFEGLEKDCSSTIARRWLLRAANRTRSTIPASQVRRSSLVNANFGCGSSREHAPQAIRRHGMRAVIGESFSEIFFGNSVALGLPCVVATHDAIDTLMQMVARDPSLDVTIDLSALQVTAARIDSRSRCRPPRVTPSSKGRGMRRRCCSTGSRKSRPSRGDCLT